MEQTVFEGEASIARRAGRLELRISPAGQRSKAGPLTLLVLTGHEGPLPPASLRSVRVELARQPRVRGRIVAGADEFAFEARSVQVFEHAPSVFAPLHAPFGLRRRDRWVVAVLLKILRLPVGPRLLRAWHARRQ